MPLRAFFSFYKEAVKIDAAQYRENLDIAMAPQMQFVYYKKLRAHYNQVITQNAPRLPETPPTGYIDAGSDDARDVIFGVFRALKRSHGYGG